MGFHLYLVSICVVIMYLCDVFGLLIICCLHIKYVSHYISICSFISLVNEPKANQINVNESTKLIQPPYHFFQVFINWYDSRFLICKPNVLKVDLVKSWIIKVDMC